LKPSLDHKSKQTSFLYFYSEDLATAGIKTSFHTFSFGRPGASGDRGAGAIAFYKDSSLEEAISGTEFQTSF